MTAPLIVELKPCPFCGGAAKMSRKSLDERFAYADEVKIECTTCWVSRGALGDCSKPGYADNSKCEQEAIERWNQRAYE